MKKYFLSIIFVVSCFVSNNSAMAEWDGAFNYDGGENLTIIAYSEDAENVVIPETALGGKSVTIIGPGVFDGKSLKTVSIPSSITTIEASAFSRCAHLTTVTVPNSVITISHNVFIGCTSLASITIPTSVTSIGSDTFNGCTSLASITIPESITTLSSSLFDGCTSLTSVIIPSSITTVRDLSFFDCSNLVYAEFLGDAPTSFGILVFKNCAKGFKIYYHEGKTGFTTPLWKDYPCEMKGPVYLYVSSDGDCGTKTPCYNKIQDAITDAATGSIILVKNGTYKESLSIGNPKSILVKGGYNSTEYNPDTTTNETFIQALGPTNITSSNGSLKFQMITVKSDTEL